MNKETFLSLMPTKTVNDEKAEMESQEELVQNGHAFISQLSMNRYLSPELEDYTIDERLRLFSILHTAGFSYEKNPLTFSAMGTEKFRALLNDVLGLADIYDLDNHYIENLLKGIDILKTDITDDDGDTTEFSDTLSQFVFQCGGMTMGDAGSLNLMLALKKALLGTYLAKVNLASLEEGHHEIYDISVLF